MPYVEFGYPTGKDRSLAAPILIRQPTVARPQTLKQAYAACERLARTSAKNFYYAFLVLPPDQRRAMCSLYAYMRHTDDLADNNDPVDRRREGLSQWRLATRRLDQENASAETWWPAFRDTVDRFQIPACFLEAVIAGVESDLRPTAFDDFASLYRYCYQVASAVGLACIRIWGATSGDADLYAEWLGIGFQLTNILRDLAEDDDNQRVYLPREDFERFPGSFESLRTRTPSPAFQGLMAFQIARAHGYYERSAPLERYLPPAGRAVLQSMSSIYRGLLRRIERAPEQVLRTRVSLSRSKKFALTLGALPTRFWPSWLTPGPTLAEKDPPYWTDFAAP